MKMKMKIGSLNMMGMFTGVHEDGRMKIAMEVRKISISRRVYRDHKDDGGRVGKVVEMYMTDRRSRI